MLLHHDKTQSHTALTIAQQITNLCLECLPHPTYSLDLEQYDYHVFGSPEDVLSRKKFSMEEDIKVAVDSCLQGQS